MEMSRRLQMIVTVIAATLVLVIPTNVAQSPAPAPTSDGIAIDQGIAYLLMVVALALTYIIH
ncbi:hypothetical protein Dsin_015280 [Dipteronia sinensis]|uniref:Uncharacterized protein n=1 Tax=Dipteronia sinensis TaxID=43782 RepID=A0AAE0E4I9_9ROSI|nr:hypothetical protein Dsin_015280 [Dipteronia sinensis]